MESKNGQDGIIKETDEFKAARVSVDAKGFNDVAIGAWDACEKAGIAATQALTAVIIVANGLREVDPANGDAYTNFAYSMFQNLKTAGEAKLLLDKMKPMLDKLTEGE